MAVYAFWNNKGGVGKSYLSFQVAAEYAKTHPDKPVLVIDLCPQANASGMLLGGIIEGEKRLVQIASHQRRRTIAGYIEERIRSPYLSPKVGADYMVNVHKINAEIPKNLWLWWATRVLRFKPPEFRAQRILVLQMLGDWFMVGFAT